VNAISPGARTRLSAGVLDDRFRDNASDGLDLAPEHVARVVAWLVSPGAADVTGRIVHAAGGAWREYETRRRNDTELVARIAANLGDVTSRRAGR
jgi:NAD(P)-dependent dehydrogenase (short-subunit alcohol dehydrogenase family)